MNNTKKLPTTGIKPTIESFFAISVCHFRDQRECKGIIDEWQTGWSWFRRKVTSSLNVIFRAGFSFRPLRSAISYHVFSVTSFSNRHSHGTTIPIRPYLLKSLDLCGVWDVSASVAWMYYKAKGYKKSLMPWRNVIAQSCHLPIAKWHQIKPISRSSIRSYWSRYGWSTPFLWEMKELG